MRIAALQLIPSTTAVLACVLLATRAGAAATDAPVQVEGALFSTPTAAPEAMPWPAAREWCARLQAHGHADWRLPDMAELTALHRQRKVVGGFARTPDEALDAGDVLGYMTAQQDQVAGMYGYWSSTRDGTHAHGLDAITGETFRLPVEDSPIVHSRAVRCVRMGG